MMNGQLARFLMTRLNERAIGNAENFGEWFNDYMHGQAPESARTIAFENGLREAGIYDQITRARDRLVTFNNADSMRKI